MFFYLIQFQVSQIIKNIQIVPQINGIYTVSHTKVNITFPLFIVGVTCFYRDEMVEYFYML